MLLLFTVHLKFIHQDTQQHHQRLNNSHSKWKGISMCSPQTAWLTPQFEVVPARKTSTTYPVEIGDATAREHPIDILSV